jgi:hypothetical protein
MRALALLLIVVVPALSFAQQRVVLDSPAYEQSMSKHLLPQAQATVEPIAHRWILWAALGTGLATAIGVIAGILAASSHAASPDRSAFTRADPNCCTRWLNTPSP